MNRRQLLKSLALAGVTPWVASLAPPGAAPRPAAYFLVTDRSRADARRLLRLIGVDASAAHVSMVPMQPAAQDLSCIRHGRLVDPMQAAGPEAVLADLAAELRQRSQPGNALVTVELHRAAPEGLVVFEQDGHVVDQVPLDRTFDRIEVPGVMGPTVFRLREGRLSVVTSSCRHAVCKKMGARAAGAIICAPNRLVATLPHGPGALLDAVTG